MFVIIDNAGLDKLIAWRNRYKQRKACKEEIDRKLMPIAWHPEKWWDWCILEDETKKVKQLWNSDSDSDSK